MRRLSSNLYVASVNGQEMLHCRCGAMLGPGEKDPKSLLAVKHAELSKAGPKVNPHGVGGRRFFLREYYCPACLRLIETEVALRGT
jgi:N-methylhydantoinase B